MLDPFAGSGTALEAALIEGFNAVGVELTDAYLPLIEQRIARGYQGGPVVKAAPKKQVAGPAGTGETAAAEPGNSTPQETLF